MTGMWDVAGEFEHACRFARPAGTLTVGRDDAAGSVRVRMEGRWQSWAKPGCALQDAPGPTLALAGTMRIEGDVALITYRRTDGAAFGPRRDRIRGDRLRCLPPPEDGIRRTSLAWGRRQP